MLFCMVLSRTAPSSIGALALQHALEHLVEELTAIGFISLVLIALSGSFEKICGARCAAGRPAGRMVAATRAPRAAPRCQLGLIALPCARRCAVSYPSGITEHWTYLDSVKGCDCCLSHTKDVAPCLAYERQCGRQFCNCNGQNPACLVRRPVHLFGRQWAPAATACPACNWPSGSRGCSGHGHGRGDMHVLAALAHAGGLHAGRRHPWPARPVRVQVQLLLRRRRFADGCD